VVIIDIMIDIKLQWQSCVIWFDCVIAGAIGWRKNEPCLIAHTSKTRGLICKISSTWKSVKSDVSVVFSYLFIFRSVAKVV